MKFIDYNEVLPNHPVKANHNEDRKKPYEKQEKKRKKDYSEDRKRKRGLLDD